MILEFNEEHFYPTIAEWLRKSVGCHYVGVRKILWGKQADVLGIKFIKKNGLGAELYLVEAKIIDSLASAYNLIGEIETRIALFLKENSAFHILYAYMAIVELYECNEVRDYADHRGVGVIKIENNGYSSLVLIKASNPMFSGNRTLSIEDFKDESWIKNKDEARIIKEAKRAIGWWRAKELFT